MIGPNDGTACWWQRRSGRIVAEFDVLCICIIIAIMTVPALAATTIPVPFTNTVINIGDIPPWIMAGVVLVTWWEARKARKEASAIGVKIDGVLAERDKAKFLEGATNEKQAGVVAAENLAEGQRQGRASALESIAAVQSSITSTDAGGNGKPLPVVDDAAAAIAKRGVEATERLADNTKAVADAAEAAADAVKEKK